MSESGPRKNGEKTRHKPVPPVEHQFKPGNPGRPKGSRNKLGEDFLKAMADDFEKNGVAAIEKVRTEKPDAYIKVIAGLLPQDINFNVNKFDGLTDEQLLKRVKTLTDMAAPLLAKMSEDADGTRPGTTH